VVMEKRIGNAELGRKHHPFGFFSDLSTAKRQPAGAALQMFLVWGRALGLSTPGTALRSLGFEVECKVERTARCVRFGLIWRISTRKPSK
jgi:hypothetical protein